MAKFSSTRPGLPADTTGAPSVENVPLLEGANVPLPSEGMTAPVPETPIEQVAQAKPSVDLGAVETTPLPSIDEATFDQRLAQAVQPTAEQAIAAASMPLYNQQGQALEDIQQKLNVIAEEEQRAKEAVSRVGALDYTSYSQLSQNFNNIVADSDLGQIQEVAKDATYVMNQIGVTKGAESTTGLNMLSSMFEVDNQSAIGGFVNSASAIAMEVMSGKINPDVQAEVQETNQDTVFNEDDMFAGMSSAEVSSVGEDPINLSNGIKREYLDTRLAAAYKAYMKNLKVSNGEDPTNASRANGDLVGPALSSVALETGLFKEVNGNDGNTYVIPNKRAIDFAKATRGMAQETIGERKGLRRPKTPANMETGWYNEWHKGGELRKRFIPRYQNTSLETKYKSPNKERGKLTDISDFAVKVGSVPYGTDAYQLGGLALLTSLAMNPQTQTMVNPKEFLGLHASRMEDIAKEAGGGQRGQRAAQQEMLKTVNKLNNSLNDYAAISLGGPEYNYHKADPTVWRWYPENLAVEMQNNLINRSLGKNPVATPIKITRDDLRAIPQMGDASKKYFLKHFKDGGKIKDKRMAIISNLVAAHKNIVGKASESMTWEERVAAVNGNFIAEHGNTGRLIKSAIDKMGIINPEGKINPEALQNFNVAINRQTQQFEAMPQVQLTPDELNAVNKWLSNSDKKTFGFVLSSYLGLADLISAVQNDTYWNPKIMADMDMNSAGRTFLAMDIGDEKVLSRTGIIFDAIDRLKGGPRKLFYQQIDKLVNNQYNDYNINTLFVNSKAATDAEKKAISSKVSKLFKEFADTYPEFYDDLGKKVLLTDDYGKHHKFHSDVARSFLFKSKYSKLRETLAPHYDREADMVKDFALLYEKAILNNSDLWNKEMPKDIVEYLQFFGRFPEPTLYYGEKAAIGSESYRTIDDSEPTMIYTPDGRQIEVKQKQKVIDPTKRGQEKRVYDVESDTHKHFTPEYNTYNQNMIGPLLGQYRESATLINAVNMVNPDKGKTPQWFAIVHDNLIVDGNGFAPYFFGVNSVAQGSARQILGFDMMGEFVQDFRRQYDDIINEFKKQVQEKGKDGAYLDIGTEGKNAAIGRRADTVYRRLKDMGEDASTADYLKEELALYEGIGWRSPDDRQGDLKNYQIKLTNLFDRKFKPTRRNKFTGATETSPKALNFIEAYFYLRNLPEKMDQFISPEGSYKKDSARDKKNKKLNEIDRNMELFLFFT